MQRLHCFNNVSIDGYFAGPGGDLSWAHRQDPEMAKFASDNASGEGQILLGRVTYEMMASYWPTPQAAQAMPVVAQRMNSGAKVVFSRTMGHASWSNTTLVKSDPVAYVRKMKSEPGPGIVILGSGSIVSQLAQARLIDEYQLVVNPVTLGKGKTLFEGLADKLPLKLERTRVFGSGCVLLCYGPAA